MEETKTTTLLRDIEIKALQLAGALRELDNHPVPLTEIEQGELLEIIEQLDFRLRATKALYSSN